MTRLLLLFGSLSAIVVASCIGESLTLPTTNCDEPTQLCNNACTNIQTDARNCGACGKTCNVGAGETCQKGVCGPPCTGGTVRCGMGCADVQNDPQNCGDCAKKCGPGESCSAGKCTISCRSGLNACPVMGSMPPPSDGGTSDAAPPPTTSNVCVDFQNDANHCGKCGNVCPTDKSFCDFGQCKLYKWSGILTNVNQDDLSPRWTECWTDTYNTTVSVPGVILPKCPQANLMLACRQTSSKTLVVAAMAPRADVLFDVGTGAGAHRIANGVAWYYNLSSSWGFYAALDVGNRSACDTAKGLYPERRMCWHTSNNSTYGGFRCGDTCGFGYCSNSTDLNGSAAYQRVIFQTP